MEGVNNEMTILDLIKAYRLINIYRVFNPINNVSQMDYFRKPDTVITESVHNYKNNRGP